MSKASIYAIAISPERGQLKKEVDSAMVIENHGIEKDGHAGNWNRQVTCLDLASVKAASSKNNIQFKPGDFAENILIDGLDFTQVTVGSRLRLGLEVILEVSQIGKEDHPSIVSRTFGVSLLPYEGLFCLVISGGEIHKGDPVEIVESR